MKDCYLQIFPFWQMRLFHRLTSSSAKIKTANSNSNGDSSCGNATTTVTVVSLQNQTQIGTTTETQVSTVTVQPSLLTVALEGPAAISSSLGYVISVESAQIEINSQLAPINPLTSTRPSVAPSPKTFTRDIVVPAAEASKTTGSDGKPLPTDVYFIAESNSTTKWLTNYVPPSALTIGTTTITISPVDRATVSPRPPLSRLSLIHI